MTNNYSEFLQQIKILLKDKKFEECFLIIKNETNIEKVKECAWDLLPEVLQWCTVSEADIHYCRQILLHFAKVANSKEMLIGLLENSEDINDDAYFISLLLPLQTVLCNLPSKRGKSLEGTLQILYKFIHSLPLPKEQNLEGDERKLMDLDENVCRINDILMNYLSFFGPFVEEVSLEYCHKHEIHYFDRILYQRSILCRYLLQLLSYPIVYLDLSHDEKKGKSTSRVCAEKVINYLSQLQGNFFLLYDLMEDKCEDNYIKNDLFSELCNGNLAYLVFVENLGMNCIPQVFTHTYNFKRHLKYIVALLSKQSSCVVYKGVTLALKLISILQDRTLAYEYLEIPEFVTFLNSIFQILTYCPIKELRHSSLDVFLQYLNKLELKAMYSLLFSQFCSQSHAKIRGLMVNTYKVNFRKSLQLCNGKLDDFIQKNLIKFFILVSRLPNKVETDLLEYSDLILESISFIYYLVLSKDASNSSKIWNHMNHLEENFIKPLHTALDLSRAHYKLRLKEVEEQKHLPKQDLHMKVTVGDELLENISPDDQIKFLNLSLITFDLIESNLALLEQNIQLKKSEN